MCTWAGGAVLARTTNSVGIRMAAILGDRNDVLGDGVRLADDRCRRAGLVERNLGRGPVPGLGVGVPTMHQRLDPGRAQDVEPAAHPLAQHSPEHACHRILDAEMAIRRCPVKARRSESVSSTPMAPVRRTF